MPETTMNPVEHYYDTDPHGEWERLDRHRTEFALTLRALREFLPPAPAHILDVGGGPGRYAIALTQQDYTVTLVDLSSASLQRAAQHAAAVGVHLAGIQQGNAVDLGAFSTASFDAVLLLGPLYHLTTPETQNAAIQEAWRVLKPNGLLFAGFLTQFAALSVCAERFPTWLVEHPDYAERILSDGIHQGEWGFTTAFYAHPTSIAPLMARNGFTLLQMIGCEGIVAHAEAQINGLAGKAWEYWVELNYRLGKDPALYGASIHLLCVGRKKLTLKKGVP